MKHTTLIDAASLQELLGTPAILVVDCRFDLSDPDAGRRAYLAGHIPGAVYADLNRDLSDPVGPATGRHPLPSPAAFAERAGHLGIDASVQVVAYDAANGSFAARLWWMLRWIGHDAVAVLDGGLKAWRARGGELQAGATTPAPRRLEPRAAADAVIETRELEGVLGDRRRLIVDARAAERFSGAVEPIDPVAGHVPGAVNHPFSANLAGDERFLPAAELRARWLSRLEGRSPDQLIAMCGSGVTACHDLLSLEVAGLPGARLYAGSWSEWIRDPRRPIERG